MTLALLYWILMLLWVVLAPPWPWGAWTPPAWSAHLILFLLLLVAGWQLFGPPLR